MVLLAIVLLYTGINFLKGINVFQKNESFFAVYDEIDMLVPSSPVVLNGLKVGIVKDIYLMEGNTEKIIMEFVIKNRDLDLPEDTEVKIVSADLLGSKAVRLTLGSSPTYAKPGDTLTSDIEMDMAKAFRKELEPLKVKTEELIGGIDEIVNNLQAVFNDEDTGGLPEIFSSLQTTMKNLETTTNQLNGMLLENRPKLKSLVLNADSLMWTLSENSGSLANILTNFESISDSLAQANVKAIFDNVESALEGFSGIMDEIENGDGSLAKMLDNDSLHLELVNSNHELQTLLNDFYENPHRYVNLSVFGKKPKKKLNKDELKQIRSMINDAINEKE